MIHTSLFETPQVKIEFLKLTVHRKHLGMLLDIGSDLSDWLGVETAFLIKFQVMLKLPSE